MRRKELNERRKMKKKNKKLLKCEKKTQHDIKHFDVFFFYHLLNQKKGIFLSCCLNGIARLRWTMKKNEDNIHTKFRVNCWSFEKVSFAHKRLKKRMIMIWIIDFFYPILSFLLFFFTLKKKQKWNKNIWNSCRQKKIARF